MRTRTGHKPSDWADQGPRVPTTASYHLGAHMGSLIDVPRRLPDENDRPPKEAYRPGGQWDVEAIR
jgi:hypothetical protein